MFKRNTVDEKIGPILLLPKKSFRYWQELFIIFFVFSFVGHYLEVLFAIISRLIIGTHWFPTVNDIIPLAAPYGLGAVALIVIIWPVMKRCKNHPIWIFIASVLITGTVELLCALLLVLIYGKNYFWDYSNQFMNFHGYICLQNCLLFGVASMIFLYYVYPHFEKFSLKFSRREVAICFWVLFAAYTINMIDVCIKEFC